MRGASGGPTADPCAPHQAAYESRARWRRRAGCLFHFWHVLSGNRFAKRIRSVYERRRLGCRGTGRVFEERLRVVATTPHKAAIDTPSPAGNLSVGPVRRSSRAPPTDPGSHPPREPDLGGAGGRLHDATADATTVAQKRPRAQEVAQQGDSRSSSQATRRRSRATRAARGLATGLPLCHLRPRGPSHRFDPPLAADETPTRALRSSEPMNRSTAAGRVTW